MRYRRITYRYTEVVGTLSGHFESEMRALVRPQTLASPLWRPCADVYETADAHIFTVELPGVDEEDIDLVVHPDALVVAGRRRIERPEGAVWHVCEIRHGPFRFDMALPSSADPDKVEAWLERGILRIRLAKRPLVVG